MKETGIVGILKGNDPLKTSHNQSQSVPTGTVYAIQNHNEPVPYFLICAISANF